MKMMLEKSKLEQFSYLSWKWVTKQWRQLNINSAFGPGAANKCTVQWWFKKLCKWDKSLEDECSGWPSEVGKDQMRAIIKAIFLELY